MNKILHAKEISSLTDKLSKSSSQLHQAALLLADGQKNFPLHIKGLKGSLNAFFIEQIIERLSLNNIAFVQNTGSTVKCDKKKSPLDFLVIVAGQKEADECQRDFETIFGEQIEVYQFPWWGLLPYRASSLTSKIFGKRAAVLSKILNIPQGNNEKPRIFIATQRAFLTPLPPPSYLRSLSTYLKKGQIFDVEKLALQLTQQGYLRVPKVAMEGEFALRGEVLDIFIPQNDDAVRIVFDFDKIEQIKTFEVESQTTKKTLDGILITPLKEVVWTDELCARLETLFEKEDTQGISNDYGSYLKSERTEKTQDSVKADETNLKLSKEAHLAFTKEAKNQKERILTELSVNHFTEGEELFYGILWDKIYSLRDYFSPETYIFCYDYDRLLNSQNMLLNEYRASYRSARQTLPVFEVEYMLLDLKNILTSQKENHNVYFRTLEDSFEEEKLGQDDVISISCEAAQGYFGNIKYLKEQLTQLQRDKWHIFIFADNANQELRIKEILRDLENPEDNEVEKINFFPLAISQGFSITEEKILVIEENEIFGRRKNMTSKASKKVKSAAIDTFVELNPGDYIVHVNYGIGLFKGIERVKSMGNERDYIKLEFADEEFAFVPIEQVNMVQRYIGSEGQKPKLDRIGSKSWSQRKAKVQQKVEEIANRLIEIYSKRKASRGFAFPKDTEWQAAFEAAFPYEDTPDQFTVTQEIKADMERAVPMDRLVCGDVGYGKTEIAMRSAFKAVMGGKQVAFLAPTTILAEQHYETCLERFKNFPVKIARMSRFVPASEQKKTLEKLSQGQIDILIGTHRIIQKDVKFKDLGLMIIDEEQRFGVKDKEKLKAMKTNIDSLAMSATPIPRTLHMSLLKIRDMSLLTTPPQNRHPVETTISEYSDEKVAEAIRREVERGGQVFYLHNRVETLEETRIKLEHIVPEMLIDTAHGQMSAEELDDIFHRFKMGGFHVLVSTTIIENGIDIPNVNTIIIDRADMYGVSQLYQLRGRVGRSDRTAFAYLFYPENKALSEVAMKRLQVINDFQELGSGFKIAMKDMEIRGAGNLLGKDQSGEVYAVGFEMYLHLLNTAIQKLTDENWQAPEEVLLELDYTGFIPETYITSAQIKMEIYKKIAAISTDEEMHSVFEELNDRFGPVPDEVSSLLSLAKIRIICRELSISSLKEKGGKVNIEFSQVSKINFDKLMKLIKLNSKSVRLDPTKPNILMLNCGSIGLNEKADFIRDKLEQLR